MATRRVSQKNSCFLLMIALLPVPSIATAQECVLHLTQTQSWADSIIIDADRMAVSMPIAESAPGFQTGVVQVFQRTNNQWNLDAALVGSDTTPEDDFGFRGAIALCGNVLVVGSPSADSPLDGSGKVHVFRHNGSAWNQEATLASPVPQVGGAFGFGVACLQGFIAVGSPGHAVSGQTRAGIVYLFTDNGSSLSFDQALTSPTPVAHGQFGIALAPNGTEFAVLEIEGSPEGVHLYARTGNQWVRTRHFSVPDPEYYDLELTDEWLIAGMPYAGSNSRGAVRTFRRQGASWSGPIDISFPYRPGIVTSPINFGRRFALSGNNLAISAPEFGFIGEEDRLGALYLHQFDGNAWIEQAFLPPSYGQLGRISGVVDIDSVSIVAANNVAVETPQPHTLFELTEFGYYTAGGECNDNHINDSCEPDCNGNAVPESCEVGGGNDCNGNLFDDLCDIFSGASADCNANLTPDSCDISNLISDDCNNDGVPDECQPTEDCNSNQVSDICEIGNGAATDCNSNLVPDQCDLETQFSMDCNNNGRPDECDILISGASFDCNGNGSPDECDVQSGSSLNCNSNLVPDECELDCNGNNIPDECDLDSATSADCNHDGVPDECQPDTDCNLNAIRDICEIGAGSSEDCNDNLVPDECDIAMSSSPDDDTNGIPDECDLAVLPGNDFCYSGSGSGPICSNDSDCGSLRCRTKNRYVSFEASGAGDLADESAVKLTVIDVPSGLPALELLMEGDVWWAGPATTSVDFSQISSPFKAAPLVCGGQPHFGPWPQEGIVHLFGPAVIPGTRYEVRLCSSQVECSEPLVVTTARFGDAGGSVGIVSFADISSMVSAFQASTGARSKGFFQMQPDVLVPASFPSFADIAEVVGAFQGRPYRFSGASCP